MQLKDIKAALKLSIKQYDNSEWKQLFNDNNEDDIDRELIEDIDNDEIECILSQLIYSKLIGGYVAHNTACVMSKSHEKAFPPIKTVKNWWINY